MVAAHQLPKGPPERGSNDDEEQRLVLTGVTFKDYVLIGDVLGHRPGLRMTYLEGTLEIMTTSKRHEQLKTVIARLLELYALLRNVRILGFGSTTYRREDRERGLEPDECYNIDTDKEFPDLAIEVVVTRSAISKLSVYQGLGVQEVWIYEDGQFSVRRLEGSEYASVDRSVFFPDLDLEVLAKHAAMPNQDAAVRAYWDLLRG